MPRLPSVLRPVLLGALIGLIGAAGQANGLFQGWSERITDRLFLQHASSPRIAVVAIDDSSILQLGRWPWPRRVHADIIRNLHKAGVKVVAYDVNFSEPSETVDDLELATALREAGNVVLPSRIDADKKTLPPLPALAAAAAAVGFVNVPPEDDGVVRRYLLSTALPDGSVAPSFAAQALRLDGEDPGSARLDKGLLRVNYPGEPLHGFRMLSAVDVAKGTADLSALAGGIVFVGATAVDLHDDQLVPTSYGTHMPGVEIHASAMDTVLQDRWLEPLPGWQTALLLVLLGAFAGLAAGRFKTRWAVLALAGALLATAIAAFTLFDQGLILGLSWPILVLFLSYGAATVERRLSADSERRQVKRAFTQYVSRSVVDAIMKDPSKLKLGGERRRMTVLFSDIRGFTGISEKLDPDTLVKTLNTYLTRMTDIVFQHEGVLDKYIGDAVMAFWNAPLEQKDHARRAVETALDMQNALVEMNRGKLFGDVDIGIGVGVNTGDMIVGNVGGAQRFEYTVIGDSVNLASRLEALTRQYNVGIIVTEEVKGELGEDFVLRRLDKVAVKGKKEPVHIHEVMARATLAAEWQRKLSADFTGAFEAYLAKDFTGAETRCADILAARPEDGPSKLLRERAQHFIKEPPPADWDGTWVYTKK